MAPIGFKWLQMTPSEKKTVEKQKIQKQKQKEDKNLKSSTVITVVQQYKSKRVHK